MSGSTLETVSWNFNQLLLVRKHNSRKENYSAIHVECLGVLSQLTIDIYLSDNTSFITEEPDLLFLKDVTATQLVTCDTKHSHPRPIIETGITRLVPQRLVDVKISVSKSPYVNIYVELY